jgi:hypothetical protein
LRAFEEAVKVHGKDYTKIQKHVHTRTLKQVGKKYFDLLQTKSPTMNEDVRQIMVRGSIQEVARREGRTEFEVWADKEHRKFVDALR